MKAFGGSVWKNDVSKTATMGVSGMCFRHALMPMRAALLCSGASSASSSIFSMTSASMSTERSKYLPPCTMRCPTASISSSESMAFAGPLVSESSTSAMASSWSAILASMTSSFLSRPCL